MLWNNSESKWQVILALIWLRTKMQVKYFKNLIWNELPKINLQSDCKFYEDWWSFDFSLESLDDLRHSAIPARCNWNWIWIPDTSAIWIIDNLCAFQMVQNSDHQLTIWFSLNLLLIILKIVWMTEWNIWYLARY